LREREREKKGEEERRIIFFNSIAFKFLKKNSIPPRKI
jgi:hypothetical protein